MIDLSTPERAGARITLRTRIVVITGPPLVGKTTLVEALSGLLHVLGVPVRGGVQEGFAETEPRTPSQVRFRSQQYASMHAGVADGSGALAAFCFAGSYALRADRTSLVNEASEVDALVCEMTIPPEEALQRFRELQYRPSFNEADVRSRYEEQPRGCASALWLDGTVDPNELAKTVLTHMLRGKMTDLQDWADLGLVRSNIDFATRRL